MSVQEHTPELSEVEAAAAKLEEIEHHLNLWNGGTGEKAKFGRNPIRNLIGWKESKEKGNNELFGRMFIEAVVSLKKIAHPNTIQGEEEPTQAPDNVVPINTTKPPTPTPDQMFNLIFKRWKDNKVNAREVCSAVIDIADRGNWNWKDPDGRMHTAREKALPFFQGFCVPNENEVYRADLSESQCRLFDFICESFFRWYERQEAAGYPGFKKQE